MTFRQLGKCEEVAPGGRWVTVTKGVSGWFAVVMWMNDEDVEPFPDPWDTGVGRYADRQSAVDEGMQIAKDEGLPYSFTEGAVAESPVAIHVMSSPHDDCEHVWPDLNGQTDENGVCEKCGTSFMAYVHGD